jgi:methionine-gamma-lyase
MTVYGGTFAFLSNYCKRLGIEVTFVDSTNFAEVQAACKPNTKVIYTETMSNPLLRISNIAKLREIADKAGAKLIVDNTFTPMIFSPYKLGAHIVVYSMTKFINGKNDCVAGAICADNEFINSLVDVNSGTAMLLGPVLDSYRATSILKNLYTLHIRMQQHSKNAMYLAKRFNEIGIKANYPGLEEHIDHSVMKEQMNDSFGYGGMIAIDLITAERANKFMEKMQEKGIGFLAVSLGYFRTLFSCSGKSTSSEVPDDIQQKMGMSEGLVRYSVGLDNDIEYTFSLIEDCLKELKYI